MGFALGALGLSLLTWVTTGTGLPERRESVLLIYLLCVVLVAVVGGLLPGLLAGVGAFLTANWFHTPPYSTLDVGQPQALVDLVVFVLVAVTVSFVVEIGARDRARAEHQRQVTARETARAEQLAETDRVRSALLAAVSHDLRTPIAGIKAAVSGLRQEDVEWPPADQAELLAAIEDGTDRLTTLVNDLLAMGRIQAGALSVHLTAVSVEDVFAGAIASCDGAVVDVTLADDVATVLADEALLERVLANVLDNALRFSPTGRAVEMTAQTARAPTGEPAIELRVIDHGPGAAPDRWSEMFAPFQRLGDATTGGSDWVWRSRRA